MGKSYNCGFRDKRYFDTKKKGYKKGNCHTGDDNNNESYNNLKIKHFKG